MVLVKDVGYSLTDINGEQYTETITREPSAWEQYLGAFTPGVMWIVAAPLVGLGLLGAYAFGSVDGMVISVVLSVVFYYLAEFDPQPTTETVEVDKPGMSVEEVMGRLVQHDEHEQMKNEEAEAQARKARRQEGGH